MVAAFRRRPLDGASGSLSRPRHTPVPVQGEVFVAHAADITSRRFVLMTHALVAVARLFRVLIPILFLVLLLLPSPVQGQQSYVTRFDAFAGYAFLDSPHVGLFENGFATQAGFRANKWLSIGIDYTWAKGDLT